MAMLPASRLESWARNSVGRRSFIQPLVEKAGPGIAIGVGVHDRKIDREVAFAAAGGDDHVGAAEDFRVSLDPSGNPAPSPAA